MRVVVVVVVDPFSEKWTYVPLNGSEVNTLPKLAFQCSAAVVITGRCWHLASSLLGQQVKQSAVNRCHSLPCWTLKRVNRRLFGSRSHSLHIKEEEEWEKEKGAHSAVNECGVDVISVTIWSDFLIFLISTPLSSALHCTLPKDPSFFQIIPAIITVDPYRFFLPIYCHWSWSWSWWWWWRPVGTPKLLSCLLHSLIVILIKRPSPSSLTI